MVKKTINYLRIPIIVTLFFVTVFFLTNAQTNHQFNNQNPDFDSNYPYIDQMLLESSRYTQTNETDPEVLQDYHDNYQLRYTQEELDEQGFELMFETAKLRVYFELDSFSIIIYNKVTDYFWSSRASFQDADGYSEGNAANRNRLNSGLLVNYTRVANVRETDASVTAAYSIYQLADVSYEQDPETLEIMPNYSTYNYNKVKNEIVHSTYNSFTVFVNLIELGFSFEVKISVLDDYLDVYIANETITESIAANRLLSITVFPFLGAARTDVIPGYVVIPDGIGALVRTNQRYNVTFGSRFYGTDLGYESYALPDLTLPIYGVVHEDGANGIYANIIEGSYNSTLNAIFWGNNTNYNRISSRFNVREIYRRYINRAGDGASSIIEQKISDNYQVRYTILSNEDASYVGIAKNYRDYLIDEEVLTQREQVNNNQIPLEISYLMSDQEPIFIGTKKIVMTTTDQVRSMYNSFRTAGITNQTITLMGWSSDGFINREPFRMNAFDGKNNLSDLATDIIEDGNSIYLQNDYVISSELSRRVGYTSDVARNISRLKMVWTRYPLSGSSIEMYYLYPERSLYHARRDLSALNDFGVSGFALDSIGSVLNSGFDGNYIFRSDAVSAYQELLGLYDQVHLYRPNAYLYQYVDGYRHMFITNSQYDYYTDLVPILPIVLKGSISYFSTYLNFNALGHDRILTMVDFGINPSYALTAEPTYKMRYTLSNAFITTSYDDFYEEIVDNYTYLNNALSHVADAYMESREVIETGLVKVTYSNGVIIYVNYSNQIKVQGSLVINQRDYRVVLP